MQSHQLHHPKGCNLFSLPVLLAPGSATGGSWLRWQRILVVMVSCFLITRLKQRGFWVIDDWADFFSKKTIVFGWRTAKPLEISKQQRRKFVRNGLEKNNVNVYFVAISVFLSNASFNFPWWISTYSSASSVKFIAILTIISYYKFHQTVLNSLSHLHHHLMTTN